MLHFWAKMQDCTIVMSRAVVDRSCDVASGLYGIEVEAKPPDAIINIP